tara:strand:+ start:152 stop:349 length:198 start_codon:yes stop_codon:yes gene_type:complete
MQNSIGSWGQVRASLPHPSEEVEEFFPILIHIEHLMCCISMQKEALAKQGEIPMKQEEDNYYHSD